MVRYRLKTGEYVNPGTLVGRVGNVGGAGRCAGRSARARCAGGLPQVAAGQPLADLGADQNHVWEALRGLYLVGEPSDLEDIRHYTHPLPGIPEIVQQQAIQTAQSIETRPPAP